jgi:ferredoxin
MSRKEQEDGMKAIVDEDICCGCGPCEEICPQVFEIVDGIAKVKTAIVPKDAEKAAVQAKENCPTEAITLEE